MERVGIACGIGTLAQTDYGREAGSSFIASLDHGPKNAARTSPTA